MNNFQNIKTLSHFCSLCIYVNKLNSSTKNCRLHCASPESIICLNAASSRSVCICCCWTETHSRAAHAVADLLWSQKVPGCIIVQDTSTPEIFARTSSLVALSFSNTCTVSKSVGYSLITLEMAAVRMHHWVGQSPRRLTTSSDPKRDLNSFLRLADSRSSMSQQWELLPYWPPAKRDPKHGCNNAHTGILGIRFPVKPGHHLNTPTYWMHHQNNSQPNGPGGYSDGEKCLWYTNSRMSVVPSDMRPKKEQCQISCMTSHWMALANIWRISVCIVLDIQLSLCSIHSLEFMCQLQHELPEVAIAVFMPSQR